MFLQGDVLYIVLMLVRLDNLDCSYRGVNACPFNYIVGLFFVSEGNQ